MGLGGAGFLRFAQQAASRSNDLLLQSDAKGINMPGTMPISSMVSAPFAFALGTPLGLLATYLTLTGLYRGVAAAVGEAVERPFAVGLRTLYPLVETQEAEVFRRIVPYVLPPLPPEG